MTTVARVSAIRAAQATAWAWFPAETVTSPRRLSSSASPSTLLSAPRGLNEPVFWKLSHLRKSRTPARSPIEEHVKTGVLWIFPARREAASRMRARSIIACSSRARREAAHTLHPAQKKWARPLGGGPRPERGGVKRVSLDAVGV